jgi:hypothetical protein
VVLHLGFSAKAVRNQSRKIIGFLKNLLRIGASSDATVRPFLSLAI